MSSQTPAAAVIGIKILLARRGTSSRSENESVFGSCSRSVAIPVIVIAPDCAGVFVLTGPTLPLLLLFFLLLGELSLDQPLDGGLPRPLPAPVISAGSGSGYAAAGQTRLAEVCLLRPLGLLGKEGLHPAGVAPGLELAGEPRHGRLGHPGTLEVLLPLWRRLHIDDSSVQMGTVGNWHCDSRVSSLLTHSPAPAASLLSRSVICSL